MDFFKSVFSDDPSPPDSPKTEQSLDPDSDPAPSWSFGGLIKTLASKSDSVIQHYRRDFEELGSGLRKETTVIREVASRAVQGLPATLEVGASVAQESLESVGQAVDDIGASVWKSTTQIISQGKERLLASNGGRDSDYTDKRNSDYNSSDDNTRRPLERKLYNRFDVKLRAIQSDLDTYCTEPEDVGEYEEWRSRFVVDEKGKEIEDLIEENPVIGEFYGRVVPSIIDNESFWSRYFYKVHKLRQVEDARAKLVNRAISVEEDEEWSWDIDEIDDDEDKESAGNLTKGGSSLDVEISSHGVSGSLPELGNTTKLEEKDDDKVGLEGKSDNGGSCKDSDVSVISTQASLPEEEDMGWDEIEDIGVTDENKGDATVNMSRADLHKKLSAAEEEEDLSWDIDDVDDEHN
ncbi:protein DOS2 [Tripterygium wilfordii]|uniref:Protein DOS2 n=1 Tax=Tripterygium wilfordii TaxID=458696 RepID=A0A7J7E151_TRIWF|nr:protein DOS2-like [Tripterygium wilfordii]KAF5752251.1 protein DOS2 [Tripterygium wilfordii]